MMFVVAVPFATCRNRGLSIMLTGLTDVSAGTLLKGWNRPILSSLHRSGRGVADRILLRQVHRVGEIIWPPHVEQTICRGTRSLRGRRDRYDGRLRETERPG